MRKHRNSSSSRPDIRCKKVDRLLILLDMNGTLLLRNSKLVQGMKSDLKVSGKHYYFRQGYLSLLLLLSMLDRLELINYAFYTSMTSKYAIPAVHFMIDKLNQHYDDNVFPWQSRWDEKIPFIYDQEWNLEDPSPEDRFGFKRDLPRLWESDIGPAGQFSALNTIMIDDSARKMRLFPENALLIEEFTSESNLDDLSLMENMVMKLIFIFRHYFRSIRDQIANKRDSPWMLELQRKYFDQIFLIGSDSTNESNISINLDFDIRDYVKLAVSSCS